MDDYYVGEWDRAIEAAAAGLEDGEASGYMDVGFLAVLAATAAARGDRESAHMHAGALITRAREIGDPQVFWSALGSCALVALEGGDTDHARTLVEELRREVSSAESFQVEVVWIDGALAAEALDLAAELRNDLCKATYDSPWVQASMLICEGRLEEAGDVLYAHEAYAYAALVRLRAAERAGHETPGLRDAVAFYERVGATAYLARAERLLQASA